MTRSVHERSLTIFLFLQEQLKDIIIIWQVDTLYPVLESGMRLWRGHARSGGTEFVLGHEWNLTQSRNNLDIHKVCVRDKHRLACERTHEFDT